MGAGALYVWSLWMIPRNQEEPVQHLYGISGLGVSGRCAELSPNQRFSLCAVSIDPCSLYLPDRVWSHTTSVCPLLTNQIHTHTSSHLQYKPCVITTCSCFHCLFVDDLIERRKLTSKRRRQDNAFSKAHYITAATIVMGL